MQTPRLCRCGAIVTGNCDACYPRQHQHDRKTTARGYGHDWQKLRARYQQEHPLCEPCSDAGRTTPMQEIHHRKPIRTHPELRLAWDNLMSVCKPCHERMEFDTHQHVVITGPPGSGKTTMAVGMRQAGDIVFDLDHLAAALNPEFGRFDSRPAEVAGLLLQWRDQLVSAIQRRQLHCRAIVIVTDREQAEGLARAIGATVRVAGGWRQRSATAGHVGDVEAYGGLHNVGYGESPDRTLGSRGREVSL